MAETKLNLPDTCSDPNNKKRLYILLAVLGVVSVLAIVINYSIHKARQVDLPVAETDVVPAGLSEDLVALLPQLARTDLSSEAMQEELSTERADPFVMPMELIGVVTGGTGKDLAIIKARQTTFIVGPGDQISGEWQVLAVDRNSVQLNRDTKEMTIELAPRD